MSAVLARLVEECAGGDRLRHGAQHLAEPRVSRKLDPGQSETRVGGTLAHVVQLGAARGQVGRLPVRGGVQVDRQLQGAPLAVALRGFVCGGAGLVVDDAQATPGAIDAVDAAGEAELPAAGRDRHPLELVLGGLRCPAGFGSRVGSPLDGPALLLAQIAGQLLRHLVADQVPGERQPGDAGRQLGKAAFHDCAQRGVRAAQVLRPRFRVFQEPLHQLVEDRVDQVAALQRGDLQGLLRLAAGADAQHPRQKETVRADREVLQGGGGQVAVQGAARSNEVGRHDSVVGAEAAPPARGLVGPNRVDGAPQRLDCGYRRLPSALFQHVPAQVRFVECPQRVVGAGAVVADARRHALVPVPGIAFQGLGGKEAPGEVSHFLE